jgi:hypothetical protein
MRRLSFLLLAACITGAAGPARNASETLPVPPIPPDISSDSEPAPMPNFAARGPMDLQVPRGPELTPTMMGPKYTYQGEAFLRGSTNQVEQNRKLRPAAGLNLTVPLQ